MNHHIQTSELGPFSGERNTGNLLDKQKESISTGLIHFLASPIYPEEGEVLSGRRIEFYEKQCQSAIEDFFIPFLRKEKKELVSEKNEDVTERAAYKRFVDDPEWPAAKGKYITAAQEIIRDTIKRAVLKAKELEAIDDRRWTEITIKTAIYLFALKKWVMLKMDGYYKSNTEALIDLTLMSGRSAKSIVDLANEIYQND